MKRIAEHGTEMVIIEYYFCPENRTQEYLDHPITKELNALERPRSYRLTLSNKCA